MFVTMCEWRMHAVYVSLCVGVCVCTISGSIQRAQVLQLFQDFVLDSLQLEGLVCQLQDGHEGLVVTAGVPDLHTHTDYIIFPSHMAL